MKGIPIIIGITGHRDICTEDVMWMKIEFRRFLDTLQKKYLNSPIIVASGLARGADTYAVEAACECIDGKSYDFIGVLPLSRELYAEDFEEQGHYTFLNQSFDSERELYHFLCDKALLLNEGPFYMDHYDASLRNLAYEAQGKRLAEHSDYLVAFFDNRSSVIQGGTADVIQIRKLGLSSPLLNRQAMCEMVGGRSTLIIPVRRLQFEAIEPNRTSVSMDEVIDESFDMINYDAFNKQILSSHLCDLGALPKPILDKESEKYKAAVIIEELQTCADQLSQHHRITKKCHLNIIFGLLIIAILSFEVFGIVNWYWLLVVYCVIYFVLLFGHAVIIKHFGHHQKFVAYRTLAELLRVQYYWTLSGINEHVVDHLPLKGRETMGWIRQALRSVEALIHPYMHKLDIDYTSLDFVKRQWIIEQHYYYVNRTKKHKRAIEIRNFSYKAGFILGFVMILGVIVMAFIFSMPPTHRIVQVALSLSGIIAAFSALLANRMDVDSFEELSNRYHIMSIAYEKAEATAKRIGSDLPMLQKVLIEIGDEAINEISDWYIAQKSKEGKLT